MPHRFDSNPQGFYTTPTRYLRVTRLTPSPQQQKIEDIFLCNVAIAINIKLIQLPISNESKFGRLHIAVRRWVILFQSSFLNIIEI